MQVYIGTITLNALHVLNNLLHRRWLQMLSEIVVCTDMDLC